MTTGRLKSSDVKDWASFARYAQQRLGTPYPSSGADWQRAKVKIEPLFEQYDHFSFSTLADLVDWAYAKGKRFGTIAEVSWHVTDAFREGALEDMLPGNKEEEEWQEKLWTALETLDADDKDDRVWRQRLLTAQGDGRRAVYQAWMTYNNEKLLEKKS